MCVCVCVCACVHKETTSSNKTTPPHPPLQWRPRAIHLIKSQLQIFLYSFNISGFAANIYVSFVLRNSQFSRFSVTPYMSALTVCDTAFLTATLFIWLQQVHDIQVLVNNGFCQIVWFTRYVCNFLSIWQVAFHVLTGTK